MTVSSGSDFVLQMEYAFRDVFLYSEKEKVRDSRRNDWKDFAL